MFDFGVSQKIYSHETVLYKMNEVISLPKLRDMSNMCIFNLEYTVNGLNISINRVKTAKNCVTELKLSYKQEFNFYGRFENFVNVNTPFGRVYSNNPSNFSHFHLSHQEFLNKCIFEMNLAEKYIERQYRSNLQEIDTENDSEELSQKQIYFDKMKHNLSQRNKSNQFERLNGKTIKIISQEKSKNCLGYYHYKRKIELESVINFEALGEGFIAEESYNNEGILVGYSDKKRISLKFEGKSNISLRRIPDDIIQIEEDKHILQGIIFKCVDESGQPFYVNKSSLLGSCEISNQNSFDNIKKFEIRFKFQSVFQQSKAIGYFIFRVNHKL